MYNNFKTLKGDRNMKKTVIVVGVILAYSSLFAGWYDNKPSSNHERVQNQRQEPQRGYEKPGDSNYLNNQIDSSIYGKNNPYQGSKPGDSDYGDRVVKGLMEK